MANLATTKQECVHELLYLKLNYCTALDTKVVYNISEDSVRKGFYFKTLITYLISPTGPMWCEISGKHLKA